MPQASVLKRAVWVLSLIISRFLTQEAAETHQRTPFFFFFFAHLGY